VTTWINGDGGSLGYVGEICYGSPVSNLADLNSEAYWFNINKSLVRFGPERRSDSKTKSSTSIDLQILEPVVSSDVPASKSRSVVKTQKISLVWGGYLETWIHNFNLSWVVKETSSSIGPTVIWIYTCGRGHACDVKPWVQESWVLIAGSDTFVEILSAVVRPNKSCGVRKTNQKRVLSSPGRRSCAHHDLGHKTFSTDCERQFSTDGRASRLFELRDVFNLVSEGWGE